MLVRHRHHQTHPLAVVDASHINLFVELVERSLAAHGTQLLYLNKGVVVLLVTRGHLGVLRVMDCAQDRAKRAVPIVFKLRKVAREARVDAPFVASGPHRSAQSRTDDVEQNDPDTWAMTWHARKRKPIAVDD